MCYLKVCVKYSLANFLTFFFYHCFFIFLYHKQDCMIGKGATPSFFAIANYNYTLTTALLLPVNLPLTVTSIQQPATIFKLFFIAVLRKTLRDNLVCQSVSQSARDMSLWFFIFSCIPLLLFLPVLLIALYPEYIAYT